MLASILVLALAPPAFVIGVWCQPLESFAKWKSRGVNTMIGFEATSERIPFETWRRELERHDLYTIREPVGDLAQDARDPRLLAWMHGDEPDLLTNGRPRIEPGKIVEDYRRLKAAAPKTKVFLNFSGGEIRGAWLGGDKVRMDRYRAYVQGGDWIGQDIYPVTGWAQPSWQWQSGPGTPAIGYVMDVLRDIAPKKPLMAFIECSNQNLDWVGAADRRSVTPAEFRGQVWNAVIHGATGIGYFPQRIGGGFSFDAMTPDVEREMVATNRLLTTHGRLLSAPGKPMDLPAPFEGVVKQAGRQRLEIVLNLSNQPAELKGQRFKPFEVRLTG